MQRLLVCFGVLAVCAAAAAIPKTTYQIITQGKDPTVEVGDTLTVKGTGSVIFANGKAPNSFTEFWSCPGSPGSCPGSPGRMPGQPFTYTEGGAVITGWATGAQGMKLGEKRKVTIPANVAYDIGDFPVWLANGGYGNNGYPADGLAGSQEYYESFAAFKNAASKWDTSEVEGIEMDGNRPRTSTDGTCTQWNAFAPGWQKGPAGSQVKRPLDGSGIAVLELEDCYGDGHVHPGLAGTGTQVFYNGQQVGPTIKGQKHTFKFDFIEGELVIGEVHSSW
jgi:hypothetical protein